MLPISPPLNFHSSNQTYNQYHASPSQAHQRKSLYLYHSRFGPDARNCQALCSWNSTPKQPSIMQPSPSHSTLYPLSDDNGPFPPELLFVEDPLYSLHFLINTGSSRSLLLCDLPFNHASANGKMFAANGSEVCFFETVHLTVSLGLERHFPWQLKRASIRFPIIGMIFYANMDLLWTPWVSLCEMPPHSENNESPKAVLPN